MFLLQKATQVTTGPTDAEPPAHDDESVREWLADKYSWPGSTSDSGPLVRVNFVSSIDGSATAAGRSGDLAGKGDKLLFGVLRSISDTVLVGASTAVTEDYGVPQSNADGDRPLLVLASRSLDIPDDYETAVGPGVLIATCESAPVDRRDRLTAAGATLLDCGTDTVEPDRLIAALGERGSRTVNCEGGPRFFADLLAAGVVDELAVTLSPTLVAGDGPRIAHGATLAGGTEPARLRHLIGDDEGFLYFLWECRR